MSGASGDVGVSACLGGGFERSLGLKLSGREYLPSKGRYKTQRTRETPWRMRLRLPWAEAAAAGTSGARDAATRARRATATHCSAPLPPPRQPPHQAPCSARPRLSECVLLARLSCPCVLDTCVQTRAEQAAACMDNDVKFACANCEDRNTCREIMGYGTTSDSKDQCYPTWQPAAGAPRWMYDRCDDRGMNREGWSSARNGLRMSCMRWAAAQQCIPSADKYRQSRKGTQCSEGHSCTSARLEGNKVTCSTSG